MYIKISINHTRTFQRTKKTYQSHCDKSHNTETIVSFFIKATLYTMYILIALNYKQNTEKNCV